MSWHFHKPCHSNNCLLSWVRLWPRPCCGVYVLPERGSIVTWWEVSLVTWVRLRRWWAISHRRNMDFLFSSTQYILCFFSYFTFSHGLSFCICPVIDHLKGGCYSDPSLMLWRMNSASLPPPHLYIVLRLDLGGIFNLNPKRNSVNSI